MQNKLDGILNFKMSSFCTDYISTQIHKKQDLRFNLLRLAEIKNVINEILIYKAKTEFWLSSSRDEKIKILSEIATIISVIEKTHYSVQQNAINIFKNKINKLSNECQELEKYTFDKSCKSLVDISCLITSNISLKPSHIVDLRILNLDTKLKISKINLAKHIISKDIINI